MQKQLRGGLMLGACAVVALASAAAFALAGRGVVTLSLEQRAVNAQSAQNRAESVLNQAVSLLMAYRETGQPLNGFTTTVQYPDAHLTFDTTATVYCTNNLQQTGAVTGWNGRKVPGHSIHLVATATCGTVTRTMEALLHQPMFPYTLFANGAIQSGGPLVLGSIKTAGDSVTGALRPGLVACNSNVDLGSGAEIKGDVQAVGTVTLEPGAQVDGHVTWNAPPAPPLHIDLSSLDPLVQQRDGVQTLPASLTDPRLSSFCRHDGTLRVDGKLTLESAVLFVNGDLVVSGGVSGNGAVIATGAVRIEGASNLASTDQLAVLCGGDLTLQGSGMDASAYKGFVYTEGSLTAANVTVIGAVVSNGPPTSVVQLQAVRLVHLDDDTALTLQTTPRFASSAGMNSALPFPNVFNHLSFEGHGATYDLHLDYQVTQMSPMEHLTFATASDLFAWEAAHVEPAWLANAITLCRATISDVDTSGLSDFDALVKYQMKQLNNAVFGPGGYKDINDQQGNLAISKQGGSAATSSSAATFDLNALLSPADSFRVQLWQATF